LICLFLYKFEYISVGIVESKKRMERNPFFAGSRFFPPCGLSSKERR
jgi:hypothetical protein